MNSSRSFSLSLDLSGNYNHFPYYTKVKKVVFLCSSPSVKLHKLALQYSGKIRLEMVSNFGFKLQFQIRFNLNWN